MAIQRYIDSNRRNISIKIYNRTFHAIFSFVICFHKLQYKISFYMIHYREYNLQYYDACCCKINDILPWSVMTLLLISKEMAPLFSVASTVLMSKTFNTLKRKWSMIKLTNKIGIVTKLSVLKHGKYKKFCYVIYYMSADVINQLFWLCLTYYVMFDLSSHR